VYNGGCSRVVHAVVAAGEVLAPGSCGVVAVGGALEPGGRTAVGAVESLLMSSCFRKGAESCRRHGACGAPSLPIWRSELDAGLVPCSLSQLGVG
jgi:hypothetical protein